jgi:CHAT domain-containing protein
LHEYYSLYIQVLMTLHQLHPSQGFMQLAFEAAEKSKVRALLDLLENTQHASCDELLAGDSDPNTLPRLRDERTGTPDAVSARPLTLDEIRGEIGDSETVLLEYALGDEKSYAWIVDREKISAYELPSATQIRRSVQAFREALIPSVPREHETASEYLKRQHAAERSQRGHSRELGKLLLGGIDLPAVKRVLIVPDGPLQYVPFAALQVPRMGVHPTLFIVQHDVTMLPSASVLAALRKAADKRPPPTAGVAILADPVFDKLGTRASAVRGVSEGAHDLKRALQDTRGSQHIVRLPGSRTEALAIQQIVGPEHTRLALGFDANRESVINGSLAHNRVIHFATHGIVDTHHPEMSGLILSLLNPKGEHQDGYLRLSDIYNLKLSADLVVLSSCDSALGKDLESEGIIGLPRGFLYAGARSVVASLWKVDDDATAALMKGLYSRMQQGQSPQAALRESQLELAKDARYRQPYYWAGFVMEGDYRWQTVSSEKH